MLSLVDSTSLCSGNNTHHINLEMSVRLKLTFVDVQKDNLNEGTEI